MFDSINSGRHIPNIIDSTDCQKHNVPTGIPCYHVNFDLSAGYGAGVCGKRISSAGYNGVISPAALQLKTPGGRGGGRNNRR